LNPCIHKTKLFPHPFSFLLCTTFLLFICSSSALWSLIRRCTLVLSLTFTLAGTSAAYGQNTPSTSPNEIPLKKVYTQIRDTIKSSLHQKPSLVAGFDSRYSFIGSGIADMLGAKLGVKFGSRFFLGLSGHQLDQQSSQYYKAYTVLGPGNTPETIQAQLQLFYLAPYAKYVFYNSKNWRLSVPVELGIGESNYIYTFNNIQQVYNLHSLVLLEPFLSCEYNINSWFGISSEFGLRLMLLNNPAVKQNLSSPTFSISLSLDYSNMIIALFPNSQIAAWLNKL
jgi:hypothetical protein